MTRPKTGNYKRKKNINLILAENEISRSYINWRDRDIIINKVITYAERYKEDVQDKVIVLEHVSENKYKLLDYISRFSDKYVKKVEAKFKKLEKKVNDYSKALFITLTVDPKNFFNMKSEYMTLQQGFNKLNTYIKKTYGIKEYVKVLEFTESNLPHLHVLYMSDIFIDIEKIRELWKKYGIGIMVNIQLVQKKIIVDKNNVEIKGVLDYILKYVKKTIVSSEGKIQDRLNRSICIKWALHARTFSISQKLVSLINRNRLTQTEPKRWIYLCSLPKLLLEGEELSYDTIRAIIFEYIAR